MPKHILFVIFIVLAVKGYSQNKVDNKVNVIGVSVPVIWNNSEAEYYRLGSRKESTGKGISYGININYSKSIYKSVYVVFGVGYFKQTFGISRPFDYDTQLAFGFSTKSYHYNSIELFGGVGYDFFITKNVWAHALVGYSQYYSYRQKYVNNSTVSDQINYDRITVGKMINFNPGVEKKINKKNSLSLNIIIPFGIHWYNDKIFNNLGYSNDEQKIARNKFSVGTSISYNYIF